MSETPSTAKRNDPQAATDPLLTSDLDGENAADNIADEWPVKDFEDFEVLDELGRGGMGVVYKCRQRSLDRQVALKVIRRDRLGEGGQKDRFRSEANAVAQLNHQHIISVYAVGEEDGRSFFAMELFHGIDLARHLIDYTLNNQSAARIIRQIAQAIGCAHERNIIHRDLKPANVLIDDRESVKVTDFGLAKQMESDQTQTLDGQIMGTPSFMSPEQAAGNTDQVDHRTDIYSIGATLYSCLTGRPPFKGNSLTETLNLVQTTDPVRPRQLNRHIHRDLETICLKCLEKDPSRRYQSAGDVEAELSRFIDGAPILARPVSRAARMIRWCQRRPAMAAMWAIVMSLSFILLTALPSLIAINLSQRLDIREQQYQAQVTAIANDRLSKAELAISTGRWADALEAFDQLDMSLLDQRQRNAIVLDRTRCFHALGRGRNAIQELTKLDNRELDDVQAALQLLWQGDLRLLHGNEVDAFNRIREAISSEMLPPAEQKYALALISESSSDAIKLLYEALEIDAYHHRAGTLLFWSLVFSGRVDDAKVHVDKAIARFPSDPNQWILKTIVDVSRNRNTTEEMLSKIKGKYSDDEIEVVLDTLGLFESWATVMENWDSDDSSISKIVSSTLAFARLSSFGGDTDNQTGWGFSGSFRFPPIWHRVESAIVANSLLIHLKQYARAANQLESKLDDDSPGDYWFLVGQCRFLETDYLAAEACFRKATERPSRAFGVDRESFYAAAMSLAMHRIKLGPSVDDSINVRAAYYARQRSKFKFFKNYHVDQLCRVALSGGDAETARFYVQKLITSDPFDIEHRILDARTYLAEGNFAQAINKARSIEGDEEQMKLVNQILLEGRQGLSDLIGDQ